MTPLKMIAHAYYRCQGGDGVGLHPFKGETELNDTGPKPPYDQLNVEGKYSWVASMYGNCRSGPSTGSTRPP